jgi:CheY-like chemotaxis protein
LIAAAYYTIPIGLFYIVRERRTAIPYPLGAGFDRHLTKPVNPDTIETLIRQLIELKANRE